MGQRLGFKHSEITKQRMSLSKVGSANPNYGKSPSQKARLKMSNAKKGQKSVNYGTQFSEEHKRKIGLAQVGCKNHYYGKKHSIEAIQKMITAHLGKPSPMLNKKHSIETREKMQVIARQLFLQRNQLTNVGRNEQTLLDVQEYLDGVQILRQYPIQKLGYIVDGYCPSTNTVYEVYEKAHDRTVQKDLQRETEICNLLSCNFHIIWDR